MGRAARSRASRQSYLAYSRAVLGEERAENHRGEFFTNVKMILDRRIAFCVENTPVENPMEEHTITQILAELGQREDASIRALMPRVYGELRRLATTHLNDDRPGHTLQPTALVNEAYVRLADTSLAQIQGRVHFFRLASKVMRQVLIDHARTRAAVKRGGGNQRVTLDGAMLADREPGVDLLVLEDALRRLEAMDDRMAQLVELRFFGGLNEQEAAEVLGISRTQASRDWRTARAWLASELAE